MHSLLLSLLRVLLFRRGDTAPCHSPVFCTSCPFPALPFCLPLCPFALANHPLQTLSICCALHSYLLRPVSPATGHNLNVTHALFAPCLALLFPPSIYSRQTTQLLRYPYQETY